MLNDLLFCLLVLYGFNDFSLMCEYILAIDFVLQSADIF